MHFAPSIKGTKNIHELTTYPNNKQALRIELTTDTDEKIIVEYREFEVGSKTEHYKLAIGGYWSPNGKYRRFHKPSRVAYSTALVGGCWNFWKTLFMRLKTNSGNNNLT